MVKAALDFQEEYAAVDHSNVYPVLARHDQIVLFDRQKGCYGERPILTLEKGHITGAVSHKEMQRHLLGLIPVDRRQTPRRGEETGGGAPDHSLEDR